MKPELNLFLDDIRLPIDVFAYTRDMIYSNLEWQIVRSYSEFVEWIQTNGLPNRVSFDHDLEPSHYTPEHFWSDYEASKKYQEKQMHTGTGKSCAIALVDYCMQNQKRLPEWYVHSQNAVGKYNITRVLIEFRNCHTNQQTDDSNRIFARERNPE